MQDNCNNTFPEEFNSLEEFEAFLEEYEEDMRYEEILRNETYYAMYGCYSDSEKSKKAMSRMLEDMDLPF